MNRYLAQEKQVFDESKFTVVGDVTVSDSGIASNYSNGNYVQIAQNPFTSPFKISLEWTTGDTISNADYAWQGDAFLSLNRGNYGFVVGQRKGRLELREARAGTNADDLVTIIADGLYGRENVFTTNTKYFIVMEFTGSQYNFYVNDELIYTFASELYPKMNNQTITIGGYGSNNSVTNGSIDLTKFKIVVDGQTVFTGTKPVHLLERRKEGYDPSKFTVVGNPTITNDGIASGFSASDYLTLPMIFNPQDKTWKIIMKATLGELGTNNYRSLLGTSILGRDWQGVAMAIRSNGTLTCWLSSAGTDWDIGNINGSKVYTEGKTYYFKVEFTGSKYELSSSDNGTNWDIQGSVNNSNPIYISTQPLAIANNRFGGGYGNFWKGSIDLTQFSITVDGKEVFTGAKENYYVLRS